MVNMAQGEIVMLGAFLIWSFARYFGLPLWLSLGCAFAVSLLLGLIYQQAHYNASGWRGIVYLGYGYPWTHDLHKRVRA